MNKTKLLRAVQGICFLDLENPKKFFVDLLGFNAAHEEEGLLVVERDSVLFQLGIDPDVAIDVKGNRMMAPLIRIETNDIESISREIKERYSSGVCPTAIVKDEEPKLRPWGAKEWGVRDSNNMVILFQEWPASSEEV